MQEPGGAELRGHGAEEGGRDGEIEDNVAAGNLAFALHGGDFFFQRGKDGGVVEISGEVVAAGNERIPFRLIHLVGGELFDVGRHLRTEAGVVARSDGDADHGEALGQETQAAQIEEGGDELAFGQVAGSAENDEDTRRAGAAVIGGRLGVAGHNAE